MATFGRARSSIGTVADSNADLIQVHSTTAVAGSCVKMTALVDGLGAASPATQKMRGVLFADNGSGAPGALIGVTNEATITGGAASTFVDMAFPTTVAVAATTVWYGLWFGSGTQVIRVYCDPTGGDKFKTLTYSSTNPPSDPFGTASTTSGHSNYNVDVSTASAPLPGAVTSNKITSSGTLTIPAPAGISAGDCLVAVIEAGTANAVGISSPGWSLPRGQLSGTNGSMWLLYKTVTASEPASYVFTATASLTWEGLIVPVTGVDPSDPTEAIILQNAAVGASATTAAVTTTGANRLLLAFFAKAGVGGVNQSWTSPTSGASELADLPYGGIGMSAYSLPAAVAGNYSVTAVEGSGNATNNALAAQTAIVALAAVPTPTVSGSGVFGRQDIGAALEANNTGTIELDNSTAIAGQVNKATAYLNGSGIAGSQNVRVVLYADNNGAPGALIAATSQVTVNQNQAGAWVDLPFATPPTVNAGPIWGGLWWGGPTNLVAQVASTGAGGSPYMTGATYSSTGNPPAAFATTGTTAAHTDLSINFTVGSGTGSNTEITFGNTTIGSSWAQINGNRKSVTGPWRPGTSGQVSKLRIYLRGTGGTQNVRPIIYDDASGVPGNLVAVGNEGTIAVNQVAGWVELLFPSSVAVSSASQYHLGHWQGPESVAGQSAEIAYNPGVTQRANDETYSTSGSPSATFGTFTPSDQNRSVYAVMSSTAGVPSNTAKPVISGTPAVGQTLTVSNGTWTGSPSSFAYQWKRGGTTIAGATSSSYLVPSGDAGATLIATVTATNASGSASVDSDPTAAVSSATGTIANTAPPVGSGTPNVGNTLTCSTGSWSGGPTSFTYQWWRSSSSTGATGWTAIVGATTNAYTVQSGDTSFFSGSPAYFSCVVTANA